VRRRIIMMIGRIIIVLEEVIGNFYIEKRSSFIYAAGQPLLYIITSY